MFAMFALSLFCIAEIFLNYHQATMKNLYISKANDQAIRLYIF